MPKPFLGEIQMDCHNSQCPARSVRVYVKDFEAELFFEIKRKCPLCSTDMFLHKVVAVDEIERELLKNSIGIVNAALHSRKEGGFCPISAFALTKLPDQWKPQPYIRYETTKVPEGKEEKCAD